MLLAKVVSRVVASEKLGNLPAQATLTVIPLAGFGDATPYIAIDSIGAGVGETVLVLQEGTGAREVLLEDSLRTLPAQMVIVGIVDHVYT